MRRVVFRELDLRFVFMQLTRKRENLGCEPFALDLIFHIVVARLLLGALDIRPRLVGPVKLRLG